MKKSLVALGVVGAFLFTTAESCNVEPKAPKTGVVTDISFDARGCYDKGDETVLLTYRPAGTDKAGDLWPLHAECVTPETASKYQVGNKYP